MKSAIHPKYEACVVTCSCGKVYNTRSSLCRDLTIEVCSECHPFYSGKQKMIDTAGRLEKFKDKFRRGGKTGEKK